MENLFGAFRGPQERFRGSSHGACRGFSWQRPANWELLNDRIHPIWTPYRVCIYICTYTYIYIYIYVCIYLFVCLFVCLFIIVVVVFVILILIVVFVFIFSTTITTIIIMMIVIIVLCIYIHILYINRCIKYMCIYIYTPVFTIHIFKREREREGGGECILILKTFTMGAPRFVSTF